jgi:hypothetical protein
MLRHAIVVLCRHPLWRDLEIVDDPKATPRQKIAARLTKIEKSILQGCMDAVTTCAPCLGGLWVLGSVASPEICLQSESAWACAKQVKLPPPGHSKVLPSTAAAQLLGLAGLFLHVFGYLPRCLL